MKNNVHPLASQRGSALIVALIAITVMSAISAILYQYALQSFQQTVQDANALKAFNAARSGAQAYVAYITHPDMKLDDLLAFLNQSTTTTTTIDGVDVVISVDTSPLVEEKYLTLTATAAVKNATKRVSIKILLNNGIQLFNSGIVTKSSLVFDKNDRAIQVLSDLKSASTVTPPINFGSPYAYYEYQPFQYPEVDLGLYQYELVNSPNTPLQVTNPNVTIQQSGTYTADNPSNNKSYGIEVNNNCTLTFDTSAAPLFILVDKVSIKGTVNIIGDHPLFLIATKSIDIQTGGSINVLPLKNFSDYSEQELQAKVSKLKILMTRGATLTQQAGQEFCGTIYAVGGTVNMNSSNCTFYGSIICDIFEGANNAIYHQIIPSNYGDIDVKEQILTIDKWYE